jgi:short-subunit dehydrogenase
LDVENHYAAVTINVEHPIKLTRIAIRALLNHDKKGVVLCVSSLSGLRSKYGSALYCATKHAVVGFVKGMGLAEDMEGVKVVAVCPGRVHTPLWTERDDLEENFEYLEDEALTPDEMARQMLELVEKGQYTGGTVLRGEKGDVGVAFEGIGEEEIRVKRELPETKRVRVILERERGGLGGLPVPPVD